MIDFRQQEIQTLLTMTNSIFYSAIRSAVCTLLVCWILQGIATGQTREWVDSSGQFKATASFKELTEAGDLVLEFEDGRTKEIPLKRMSKADIAFVRELEKERNQPPVTPAPTPPSKTERPPDTTTSDINSEDVVKMMIEHTEDHVRRFLIFMYIFRICVFFMCIGALIVTFDAFRESFAWGILSITVITMPLYIVLFLNRSLTKKGVLVIAVFAAIMTGAGFYLDSWGMFLRVMGRLLQTE